MSEEATKPAVVSTVTGEDDFLDNFSFNESEGNFLLVSSIKYHYRIRYRYHIKYLNTILTLNIINLAPHQVNVIFWLDEFKKYLLNLSAGR